MCSQTHPKDVDPKALELMTMEITGMNGVVFMKWLRVLDNQLTEPSFLFLDSVWRTTTSTSLVG